MGNPIRLGVVGHGGRISGLIKGRLREADPEAIRSEIRVVGIVDPDVENARARLDECDRDDVVFYPTLKKMVSQARLDGVLIGTRCNLHTRYALEALKYDIPLFLEKPVSVTMAQAKALEMASEKTKCPVVVSFPLRVSPIAEMTRKLIDEGAVGKPIHVNAVNYVHYGPGYWSSGYTPYNVTRGMLLQKATHDFDCLAYIMADPIVRVAAMESVGQVYGGTRESGLKCSTCGDQWECPESPQSRSRVNPGPKGDHPCLFSVDVGSVEEGMLEECTSVLLEFESGAHGVYSQVFFVPNYAVRGATISGYNGTVRYDWYKNEIERVRHHQPFTDFIRATHGGSHFGGDAELARDYIGIIRGRIKEPRATLQMGIQSAYTCLAAKESAVRGRFVKVRQVGQAR